MVALISFLAICPSLISQDLDRLNSPLHEMRSLAGSWVSDSVEFSLAGTSEIQLIRKAEISFANEGRTMCIQELTTVEKDKPPIQGPFFIIHAASDWKSTRGFMFGDPSDDPIKLKATWDGKSLTIENPSVPFESAGTPDVLKGKKIGIKQVLRKIDSDKWEMASEAKSFGAVIKQKVVYVRRKD